MSKIFNAKSLITIVVVMGVVVAMFFLMRSCGSDKAVSASVSATEITLGQHIIYMDSTSGAHNWLWEFGNGDYSVDRAGVYTFPDEGRYQIRLKVNNNLEKLFLVRVRPYDDSDRFGHLIRIDAPQTAVQGEYILFSGEGNDKDWKWDFGENGIIDSREKTAIYAYRNHGVYRIALTTENTQYPIYHQIEVLPKYMSVDSLDVMTAAALDIKERLQNIADGKPFNANYNHVMKTYLNDNPNVLVTVNNTKRNDFYSYCQGLRISGRRRAVIDNVYVEAGNTGNAAINHILVLQHDK